MKRISILSLLFLAVSAIGANAQKSYLNAQESVKIGGKSISVKSEIYLNLMPGIIGEGKPDCAKTGTLIAPVTVQNADKSKLPKGIEVHQIWLKNNNIWRQIRFNRDETNLRENTIYSVARDCPGDKLKTDMEIIAVVELKYKGKSYFVRSNQTKLQKVY